MDKLLEKYWEGTTTLEEEHRLRLYFTSGDVKPDHLKYKNWFAHSGAPSGGWNAFNKVDWQDGKRVKNLKVTRHMDKTSHWKAWASAAAVVCAIIGLGAYTYFYTGAAGGNPDLGTYDNPEVAYKKTLSTLQMVSDKMQEGQQNIQPVKELVVHTNRVFNLNP